MCCCGLKNSSPGTLGLGGGQLGQGLHSNLVVSLKPAKNVLEQVERFVSEERHFTCEQNLNHVTFRLPWIQSPLWTVVGRKTAADYLQIADFVYLKTEYCDTFSMLWPPQIKLYSPPCTGVVVDSSSDKCVKTWPNTTRIICIAKYC